MQRALATDEELWLRAWPEGVIGLGPNAGPNDRLYEEAQRIALSGTQDYAAVLPLRVYNCGVMVMRRATWQRLYDAYMALWPDFAPRTAHYAANQFLQCAVVHALGLLVWELPASFHTHGCFGLPVGIVETDDAGTLAIDGELVLFRHHWKC
jgi:hypothetical protein